MNYAHSNRLREGSIDILAVGSTKLVVKVLTFSKSENRFS